MGSLLDGADDSASGDAVDTDAMPDSGGDEKPGTDDSADSLTDPASDPSSGDDAKDGGDDSDSGDDSDAGASDGSPDGDSGLVCQPGARSCNGSTAHYCNGNGTGWIDQYCDPVMGESCQNGSCTGDCAQVGRSYIGCEYWAVTTSNSQLDQATFTFSVSLSNTSASTQASVTIDGPNAFSKTVTIAPGALTEVTLPWVNALSSPGVVSTTALVKGGAYHIRSTEPLSAYEFNARDYQSGAAYSYTNDASLLLPVNALTGNYRVLAQATWNLKPNWQFPGVVAIVGTQSGTSVTYASPSGQDIAPGAGLSKSGGTVTLDPGDVLQITSALGVNNGVYGSDQSGASVAASAPVEVIGGSDCSFVPDTVGYCDHMEQSNFPIETLGADYLVAVPNNVNGTPRQFVKIVGTANGTTLTYDPSVGAPTTVGAGQALWFETTQHFHLTASQPVFVGQYMEGEDNFAPADTAGDPSLSLAVATKQFRKDYQFVAPANYMQNWVDVIAPTGAQIAIDGTSVPANQFAAIGNSGYGVAHVSLCANNQCSGVHAAAGNKAFGVEVYGYGSYTSYMYPGGLNLTL